MTRTSPSKSGPNGSAPRVVRRDVNITLAQDEALAREAQALGIGKNELLRRVLDTWREALLARRGA